MPALDRRIQVGIQQPDTTNEDGTPVPGPIVDREVWAAQRDYRFTHQRGSQTTLRTERRWRVRYRPDLVAAYQNGALSVVADGQRYAIEAATEIERRKWLELSVYLEES